MSDVVEKMTALRDRAISFAIDDFGSGYFSLSYLKRMPLQELKIDRSFVRDVLTDGLNATIARAVIALAGSSALVSLPKASNPKNSAASCRAVDQAGPTLLSGTSIIRASRFRCRSPRRS